MSDDGSNPTHSPDGGPHGCMIFVDETTGLAYGGAGERAPEHDQPAARQRDRDPE